MRFSSLSLRSRLLLLVVASLLPLLGFSLVSQYLGYRDAVARTSERIGLLTRGMAFDLDQEFGRHIAVLEALTVAPGLQRDDLGELRLRLGRIADQNPGLDFVVLDLEGRELVNTAWAPGVPLPSRNNRDSLQRAAEAGVP
ncbi:MAG: hypothetical protein JO021_07480, partial [Alphaproteobacteria bacterium]|nr:hypothetical protein [Alphaproteobacteria bacterium]